MIFWVLMGAATSYLAYQRGRDPYIWFAAGIFFGVLAMLVLVFLPPGKSKEEQEVDQRNEEIIERREKQIAEEEKIENAQDLFPQSIETKEWFYLDGARQQQGPFSFYVMNELWQNKDISENSLVWTEGMEEWKQIQDISDLYHVLESQEQQDRAEFPKDL
jgi:hypothetical protein